MPYDYIIIKTEVTMNKMSLLLVLFWTLGMVSPASAQVHVGVLGGLNLANLSVNPDEGVDWSKRTVYGFGGVLAYDLSESVGLYLEPMYLQKGTEGTNAEGTDIIAKLTYIEVPVLFKYAFGASNTKPYLIAGPSISFNLSAKVEDKSTSTEIDVDDRFKSVDFGLGFGAGVSLLIGNNSIFVEARYALGLSNINDDPDIPDTNVKTKGIQFFAGITFVLRRK